MHLEVLICTHNRAALLNNVLESLNQIARPSECKITICVIANACNDKTHSILQEYISVQVEKNCLPLIWHEVSTPGKSHALNYAIPQLTGDLIAMIDDDHRISTKYFNVLCSAYNNYNKIDVFFGKILPDWNGQEPPWAHEKGKYAIYPLPVPRFDQGDIAFDYTPDVPIPGGGNLALKRSVFKLVGEFSTQLGPSGHDLAGGEDNDYIKRALSMNMKLRYVPDMVQYHLVEPERFRMKYILTKSFQRSRSVVLINNDRDKKIPNYLWKKLLIYGFSALFSLSFKRTRFFLVRIAATLGEMSALTPVK